MSPYIIEYRSPEEAHWLLHGPGLSGGEHVEVADPLEALELVKQQGGRGVIFTGHEPLLHPLLPQWLRHGRQLGIAEIGIKTNARRLASADVLDELTESGLTMVDGIIMGSQSASHDYHSGHSGSFLETASGLQHAIQKGLRVGVTVPVTRSNYRELPDLVHWCEASTRSHSSDVCSS